MHDRRFQNWVAALVASGAGTLPDDKLSSVTRGAITYAESEIRTATAQLKADLHEKEQQVNRLANLLTEIRNATGAANFPDILDRVRALLRPGKDTGTAGESTRAANCLAFNRQHVAHQWGPELQHHCNGAPAPFGKVGDDGQDDDQRARNAVDRVTAPTRARLDDQNEAPYPYPADPAARTKLAREYLAKVRHEESARASAVTEAIANHTDQEAAE